VRSAAIASLFLSSHGQGERRATKASVRQLTIGAAVAVTGRVLTSYASLVTATVTDMLLPGAPW